MKRRQQFVRSYNRRGFALLMTVVILVLLATLAYSISMRLNDEKYRIKYFQDYQKARYGCDSGLKFALMYVKDMNVPEPIARPNEPDFSEVFTMSDEELEQYLSDWNEYQREEQRYREQSLRNALTGGENDSNDANGFDGNDANEWSGLFGDVDVNDLIAGMEDSGEDPNFIPGPYGPEWPFVKKPLEFSVGDANVRIEIVDENAKYPMSWLLLDDDDREPGEGVESEVESGFDMFCAWMDLEYSEIEDLKDQFEDVKEIRTYKTEFKPIKKRERVDLGSSSNRSKRRRRRRSRYRTITITVEEQKATQSRDLAKLLDSGMIDDVVMKTNRKESDEREESLAKYTSTWNTGRINVNSAPKHVLETAFEFGGNSAAIADEIIRIRQYEPINDFNDLRKQLGYATSLDESEDFITMKSSVFTIKVTATSGLAIASAEIAVQKDGGKLHTLGIIQD